MSRFFDSSQVGAAANYVEVPKGAETNNLSKWTVMAWILPLNFGGNGNGARIYNSGTICVKDPQSAYNMFMSFENGFDGSVNIVSAICGDSDATPFAVSVGKDNSGTIGKWQHFCNTWDGTGDGKLRCYVNGTEQSPYVEQIAGLAPVLDDSGGDFFIGNDPGFDDGFGGYIAYLRTWTDVLTQAEIESAMTGGNPKPGSAALYLPLKGIENPEPNIGIGGPGALSATPPLGAPLVDPFISRIVTIS